MSWIKTIDPDDAPEPLRDLYEEVRDPHSGQLDNIMRVHSRHPDGLRAHFDLYSAVMRGTASFRKVEREMVALVVSVENECGY